VASACSQQCAHVTRTPLLPTFLLQRRPDSASLRSSSTLRLCLLDWHISHADIPPFGLYEVEVRLKNQPPVKYNIKTPLNEKSTASRRIPSTTEEVRRDRLCIHHHMLTGPTNLFLKGLTFPIRDNCPPRQQYPGDSSSHLDKTIRHCTDGFLPTDVKDS
jgi:hypothetical protein